MSSFRKNTLVVDFSGLPKRPDAGEVQQFLEKKVKLKLEDTTTIQLHNIRNVVYIETIDSETALRYEKANHYTITCKKTEFKIPVYVDSEAVTVRVHDLPTHTPHQTVADFMGQYGVVISIARERWKHHFPGFFNGVRVLRIRLSRQIPSTLVIDGEKTLVTYPNQPKTCHHCGKAAHPKQKCAKASHTAPTPSAPTPTPSAAGASDSQRNGEEFPSLLPISNEQAKIHLDKNDNEPNKTSDNGDDCDDDEDDEDDEDNEDGDGTEEDGDECNNSSDDDFFEATTRKRRMSKLRANEMKKVCVNEGTLDHGEISNRYQALEQLDPMCPPAAEMQMYSNRLRSKHKV